MAQHTMVVTSHGTYSSSSYDLYNSSGSGLQTVYVFNNGSGGSFSGTSATVGVNSTDYAALWADVTNAAKTTTLYLQVTGSTVTSFSWTALP